MDLIPIKPLELKRIKKRKKSGRESINLPSKASTLNMQKSFHVRENPLCPFSSLLTKYASGFFLWSKLVLLSLDHTPPIKAKPASGLVKVNLRVCCLSYYNTSYGAGGETGGGPIK